MIIFVIIIHVLTCIGLIGIVLIQRGRGSGLVESFAGVESMFGTKTSAFLTRTTTVLSVLFFVTCLTLAAISLKQSRSLMRNIKTPIEEQAKEAATESGAEEAGVVKVVTPEQPPTEETDKVEENTD